MNGSMFFQPCSCFTKLQGTSISFILEGGLAHIRILYVIGYAMGFGGVHRGSFVVKFLLIHECFMDIDVWVL